MEIFALIYYAFLNVGTLVGCILSLFVVIYIHFHIIHAIKALSKNRVAAFKCSDGTPPSCRAEPASPWHPLTRWHPQLLLPCTPPQYCDPCFLCRIGMWTAQPWSIYNKSRSCSEKLLALMLVQSFRTSNATRILRLLCFSKRKHF